MNDELRTHLAATIETIDGLAQHFEALGRLGSDVAETLCAGGRLLAAGNGGSAAQAQHLTAELVGRYARERRPLSAIALHADTSTLTAIGNDYGLDSVFARQVEAHGRPGDIAVLLSTSGRSPNVVSAAAKASDVGMRSVAFTGARPNPLADACHDAIAVDAPTTAAVQEAHLVLIHLLCEAVDAAVLGHPEVSR